jgi:hypothetical protein
MALDGIVYTLLQVTALALGAFWVFGLSFIALKKIYDTTSQASVEVNRNDDPSTLKSLQRRNFSNLRQVNSERPNSGGPVPTKFDYEPSSTPKLRHRGPPPTTLFIEKQTTGPVAEPPHRPPAERRVGAPSPASGETKQELRDLRDAVDLLGRKFKPGHTDTLKLQSFAAKMSQGIKRTFNIDYSPQSTYNILVLRGFGESSDILGKNRADEMLAETLIEKARLPRDRENNPMGNVSCILTSAMLVLTAFGFLEDDIDGVNGLSALDFKPVDAEERFEAHKQNKVGPNKPKIKNKGYQALVPNVTFDDYTRRLSLYFEFLTLVLGERHRENLSSVLDYIKKVQVEFAHISLNVEFVHKVLNDAIRASFIEVEELISEGERVAESTVPRNILTFHQVKELVLRTNVFNDPDNPVDKEDPDMVAFELPVFLTHFEDLFEKAMKTLKRRQETQQLTVQMRKEAGRDTSNRRTAGNLDLNTDHEDDDEDDDEEEDDV